MISFDKIYWNLAVLRVVLVCIPQTGYIHPDEYFQSVEILAGKFLDVEYSPPWEFNSTFPIRSMALNYFTIGLNYNLLKALNYITNEYFTSTIINPYFLLIFPRLLMCLCSFLVDFSLFSICKNNNEKYRNKLIILSSSYVMIVYATRTFSNTIELILFAVLLYYVCESLTFSNILLRKREYLNYRYEQSKTTVDKAKFHKLRLFLSSDSLRNCFIISTVTVFGFFNRPTFLAFAIIPIFFWLYRGIGSKVVMSFQFHIRIIAFVLCTIPSFIFIILIDSFFYGYITWGDIGMLDISINSFVFTPLNFLKYNLNSENLAIHGLHPRFLHVLVNIPLLFNVLGLCAFVSVFDFLQKFLHMKFHLLPTRRSIKGLMTLSLVTPLAVLSLFPHQEPRFLIPLVVPLVYLHGNTILPETENVVAEAKILANGNNNNFKIKKSSYILLKLWIILNTFLVIFYGFIHQGGVYQATNYLSKDLKVTPLSTKYHIITSHMYSIPESFLLQKPSNKLYNSGHSKYSYSRRVYLYEEGSKELNKIIEQINLILKSNDKNKKFKNNQKYKVYLLISSSLEDKLNYWAHPRNISFSEIETYYPHLSTEAFPDFHDYYLDITSTISNNWNIFNYCKYLTKFFAAFGLKLYEVSWKKN